MYRRIYTWIKNNHDSLFIVSREPKLKFSADHRGYKIITCLSTSFSKGCLSTRFSKCMDIYQYDCVGMLCHLVAILDTNLLVRLKRNIDYSTFRLVLVPFKLYTLNKVTHLFVLYELLQTQGGLG